MDKLLNIALPKGRLGEKVYDIFEKAGYGGCHIHTNVVAEVFGFSLEGIIHTDCK